MTEQLLQCVLGLQQTVGLLEGRIGRLEGMMEVILALTLATLAAVVGPPLAQVLVNHQQKRKGGAD